MKRSPDQFIGIFDSCHEAYVRAKFAAQRDRAPSLEVIGAPGNAVETGNRECEYVASFEMAGRSALNGNHRRRGPKHKNSRRLFQIFIVFFCERMIIRSDYAHKAEIAKIAQKELQQAMQITADTFWKWHDDVRRIVGQELERRGMYPPASQLAKSWGPSVKSQLKEARLI